MITTDAKLAELLLALRTAKWIALDTEADSLHAYPEKLCLMQLSIEGRDALLDTLAKVNFSPLFDVLQNHELILHGSDYDLRLLRKTYNFVPSRIFDTMLASRLLGIKQVGLVHLVDQFLHVKLEKGPQKADWGRRPLTARMEEYARHDTHYLKPLSDLLRDELKKKGRLEWHKETCLRFIEDSTHVTPSDPDNDWRIKGSHKLDSQGLAVLREIYYWRESEAIAANRPPFFIISPETMVNLADAASDEHALETFMPRRFSPRRRSGLLDAIHRGLHCEKKPAPLRHTHQRLTDSQARRYREIERKRDRIAEELDLDPSLIASRATILAMIRNTDQSEPLMKWQRDLLCQQ